MAKIFLVGLTALFAISHAEHPCEAEVATACPDTPGAEIAACLKDSSQHDAETTISSECTDFIALNLACAEDIQKSCDENYFSEDTTLCLSKWTDAENISPKCSNVMKWALPDEEVAEEDVVTDELGMSDADKKEKAEWQAKRRAARGDAIERIKMKDVDRKKEEDRASLEEFKKTDPEGYRQMMEQQEEEKRQQIAFKKRERALAAALERKKKVDSGDVEEEETPGSAAADKPKKKKSKGWGSTLYSICGLAFLGAISFGAYKMLAGSGQGSAKAGKKKGQGKKK